MQVKQGRNSSLHRFQARSPQRVSPAPTEVPAGPSPGPCAPCPGSFGGRWCRWWHLHCCVFRASPSAPSSHPLLCAPNLLPPSSERPLRCHLGPAGSARWCIRGPQLHHIHQDPSLQCPQAPEIRACVFRGRFSASAGITHRLRFTNVSGKETPSMLGF